MGSSGGSLALAIIQVIHLGLFQTTPDYYFYPQNLQILIKETLYDFLLLSAFSLTNTVPTCHCATRMGGGSGSPEEWDHECHVCCV